MPDRIPLCAPGCVYIYRTSIEVLRASLVVYVCPFFVGISAYVPHKEKQNRYIMLPLHFCYVWNFFSVQYPDRYRQKENFQQVHIKKALLEKVGDLFLKEIQHFLLFVGICR